LHYVQSRNSGTEQDILLMLSESDDTNVLKNLAANAVAPHDALLRLSKRTETYLAVAKNPSTSNDILFAYVRYV